MNRAKALPEKAGPDTFPPHEWAGKHDGEAALGSRDFVFWCVRNKEYIEELGRRDAYTLYLHSLFSSVYGFGKQLT